MDGLLPNPRKAPSTFVLEDDFMPSFLLAQPSRPGRASSGCAKSELSKVVCLRHVFLGALLLHDRQSSKG